MDDDDRPNIYTDEEVRAQIKSQRATALTVGAIVMAIGLAVAYLIWPSGITDLPLGSIAFGSLLRAIGAGVVAVAFFILGLMLAS